MYIAWNLEYSTIIKFEESLLSQPSSLLRRTSDCHVLPPCHRAFFLLAIPACACSFWLRLLVLSHSLLLLPGCFSFLFLALPIRFPICSFFLLPVRSSHHRLPSGLPVASSFKYSSRFPSLFSSCFSSPFVSFFPTVNLYGDLAGHDFPSVCGYFSPHVLPCFFLLSVYDY